MTPTTARNAVQRSQSFLVVHRQGYSISSCYKGLREQSRESSSPHSNKTDEKAK